MLEEKHLGQNVYYSVGIHPMKLDESEDALFEEVASAAREEKVIAIGECGLDRRSPICMKRQEKVLEVQVRLAEALHKPLIIHCVRAYSELIGVRKRVGASEPWIIHGYNNNEQTLRQLLDHGFYISLGGALLNGNSNASRLLRAIPSEALFLENDDKEVGISVVYEAAASGLGIDVETLKGMMMRNYNHVFYGLVE